MDSTAKGCLIAFAVVAVVGVVLAGLFIFVIGRAAEEVVDEIEDFSDENFGTADPSDYDAELTACLAEPGGLLAVEGEITNTGSSKHGFEITASLTTGDGVILDTVTVFTEELSPDTTRAWRGQSGLNAPTNVDPTDVTCTIDEVQYFF